MADKHASKKSSLSRPGAKAPPAKNLLLMLSLLPLIAGVLLVFAWVLDINIWGDAQFQVSLAILLMLVSFAISNAVQKLWFLAAGWTLLAVADLILILLVDYRYQIVAFVIGGVGLVLVGYEFFRRIQAQGKAARKEGRKP